MLTAARCPARRSFGVHPDDLSSAFAPAVAETIHADDRIDKAENPCLSRDSASGRNTDNRQSRGSGHAREDSTGKFDPAKRLRGGVSGYGRARQRASLGGLRPEGFDQRIFPPVLTNGWGVQVGR